MELARLAAHAKIAKDLSNEVCISEKIFSLCR